MSANCVLEYRKGIPLAVYQSPYLEGINKILKIVIIIANCASHQQKLFTTNYSYFNKFYIIFNFVANNLSIKNVIEVLFE